LGGRSLCPFQRLLFRIKLTALASCPAPQVFVGGNHVGGCDDTVAAYNSGKLKTLLEAAGVNAKL